MLGTCKVSSLSSVLGVSGVSSVSHVSSVPSTYVDPWDIGSHGFKVQSTNLNLKICTKKFGKNLNFWRQIQIAIWFGVRFNLTGEEEAAGHMNNKGTL